MFLSELRGSTDAFLVEEDSLVVVLNSEGQVAFSLDLLNVF